MKRLSPIRRWAFLLIRAGNNDLAEERIEQALEKQMAVLQMAKHQLRQSTVIEMLVGKAIEALALGQFKRFIVAGDAAEKHISVIEEAVVDIKHGWTHDWPRILDCEKLLMKNMLCGFFYEVNPEGKTRLSRNPGATIRTQWPKAHYWRRKVGRVGTILLWFFAPSTPQKAGEIIDAAYERYYAMAESDFDWKKEPEKAAPRHRFNYRFTTEMLVYPGAGLLQDSRFISSGHCRAKGHADYHRVETLHERERSVAGNFGGYKITCSRRNPC